MFSSAGAQPISLKSFRGLGHFPNRIARVYKHEHCLPSAFRSWQVMRSGYRRALLAKCVSQLAGNEKWVPPCIACQNGKLRCGCSPDLLAILQGNPGRTTPVFASVHTLSSAPPIVSIRTSAADIISVPLCWNRSSGSTFRRSYR